MKNHLIIPHKNRLDCLVKQFNYLDSFIKENNLSNDITINYIEQENEIFNLGYSINTGFQILKQYYDVKFYDNFWFYPIDILPKIPTFNLNEDEVICTAKGKAIGIKVKNFEKINGWSIQIYGYGYDDHDLFNRCNFYNIVRYDEHGDYFQFLESQQKDGQKCLINLDKNKSLCENSKGDEKTYKNNGLSSTAIEILDRFPLSDNEIIYYNKFKIINII